ncbi:hypothetical protein ACFFP0_19685 [Rhizobium puerariae]|uniref:CYTH domain-containing protein n=1 Tax=Rhizobium puerariae TaxID=1585791 RepID=A0ABV6AKD2_9HYPH
MKLSSREYKLTLHEDRFAGSEAACLPHVAAFWKDTAQRLAGISIEATRKLDHAEPEKQRDIVFLDTRDKALYRQADLVFRMRRKVRSKEEWETTLKFRHGDRLLAAAQTFRSAKGEKEKFEEDVKVVPPADTPRFWALFSRSSKGMTDGAGPSTVGDCLELYENFGKMFLPSRSAGVLEVGKLRIREHVFEGGRLDLGEGVEAECALILWWKRERLENPIAAEFSFRFELENGEAEAGAARKAWAAMVELCSSPWVDPQGQTKTALVYGSAEV